MRKIKDNKWEFELNEEEIKIVDLYDKDDCRTGETFGTIICDYIVELLEQLRDSKLVFWKKWSLEEIKEKIKDLERYGHFHDPDRDYLGELVLEDEEWLSQMKKYVKECERI